MQVTAHQPPITKASQTSAWSYKYIGDWMGKTERSPIGFIAIFRRLKSWKIPLAKVVDFEPLGALSFWSRRTRGRFGSDLMDSRMRFERLRCIWAYYSNVWASLIHQTLIFTERSSIRQKCPEENHCNSLLKWTTMKTNFTNFTKYHCNYCCFELITLWCLSIDSPNSL